MNQRNGAFVCTICYHGSMRETIAARVSVIVVSISKEVIDDSALLKPGSSEYDQVTFSCCYKKMETKSHVYVDGHFALKSKIKPLYTMASFYKRQGTRAWTR